MKILRIAMDGEEKPHYTLTKAFELVFSEVKTIWWQQTPNLNEVIIKEVTNGGYDAVFLQIQNDGIISEEAAKAISEHSVGFNWTGDVRTNIDWYIKLGKYFVTLFTNMHDVEKMRKLGLRAEYLQVGYDHKYYYPNTYSVTNITPSHNNIVFCANYYNFNDYPLTGLRKELVFALKREFGDRFNLYGGGWEQVGLHAEYTNVNNEQEAEIYRTCGIAINCSHFNYSRYSSDRVFREMASGAFVLSHRFKDYDLDFTEDENIVTWGNIPELIKKCHYYLDHQHERERIAMNGAKLAASTANWETRVLEFKDILLGYAKPSNAVNRFGYGLINQSFLALGTPIALGTPTNENPYYQPLFDYFSKEHNLNLLESDMQEVVDIVNKMQSLPNKNFDYLQEAKDKYVSFYLKLASEKGYAEGYAGDIEQDYIELANNLFSDNWQDKLDPFTGRKLIEIINSI